MDAVVLYPQCRNLIIMSSFVISQFYVVQPLFSHFVVDQSLFIINLVVILMCLCSDVDHESAGGCGLL